MLFFLPVEEVAAFLMPLFAGLAVRQILIGFIAGIALWYVMRRFTAGRGWLPVLGLIYWWVPKEISPFKRFPDSGTRIWRG